MLKPFFHKAMGTACSDFLRLPLLVTWIAWAFLNGQGFSQQQVLKFDRIASENILTVKGLSQNSVYCLMQDSRGFIWIGTWDGLNKYDGYDFTIYNTANGLSNPTINSILEDNEKNIWIGTDYGLNLLERESGKITQFHQQAGNKNSLSHDFINQVYQCSNGYLWICTAFGLDRFNKDYNTFTTYNFFERNADSSLTNFVTAIREGEAGCFWIATRAGIHRFDPQKQQFEMYKIETDITSPDFKRSNYVQDIILDEYGHVFAATLNGVFMIKPGQGIIQHLKENPGSQPGLSSNHINVLLADSKGNLWIGTNRGLDHFDPVRDVLTSYRSGPNITNLSNEDVRSIFEDQAGTIWIGTYKGLNKVDRSPSRFLYYKQDPEDPNSLSDNIIYAILEDRKGLVWIGTYGGINIFDKEQGTFSVIRQDPDDPNGLSSDKIRTLALDSAGYIWVGTESRGMNRFDPQKGTFTRFRHAAGDSTTIAEDNILSTYVDSKGRVWIGTVNNGVSVFDPATGRMKHFDEDADPGNDLCLSNNKIWSVYEDRQGNFWLGTNFGLNKLSNDLREVEVFNHDPLDEYAISSDRIFAVYQDSSGIFWIGTMGGGLNRFDPATGKFRHYDEKNGLPNNVVYGMLDDGEGNLWISTNWGLSRFNILSETFISYDSKDGLQSNEFNAGAYYKNSKGEMFFGGMNGFNVFHPSEITFNLLPPRMAFTGFRVLNVLQRTDIGDGEIIRLRNNENFFAIEFSGLDYTNPTKNLYRYKLQNYDSEWILATANQRKAEYRKVAPGSYRFFVTGSNNDGIWNENGISLTIIIKPPWYNTWIFRLSVLFFLTFLIWGIVLARIRTVRKKHEVERKMLSIEKQIFELEQKALRLQMNPHFMFNSLNAIQNFVLANDTDKAVNYLAKFSHLMRMILANSTASLITLKDELKSLTYYLDLEKLRFDDKFDYIIDRDPAIDEEFVEIPPMLFQPYVENAIIHGLINSPRRGLLEINLKRINRGTLLCTIRDNGIGREKANELRNESGIKRQPKGMIITQERIEIFNKQNRKNFSVKVTDLKDQQGEATGTQVEFTIHYKEI